MRIRTASLCIATLAGSSALAGVAWAQAQPFALDQGAPVDEESGISLPQGFRAQVFADGVGRARHVAVRANGDVYVALREQNQGGGVVALRDEDGDGQADRTEYFGDHAGTGIALHDGHLYASSDSAIYRYALPDDALVPPGEPEVVVEGFPEQKSHASKAFAIDDQGNLYVNVGAPSNACQAEDRTYGSPGQDPCPLLEEHAGIWRFDANKTQQTFGEDGGRFVTGTRNVVALDWNPASGELYFVQHGRDQLHELFPDLYTEEESAELPAEEFHVAREGADYGWPYTYWDHNQGARVVAPEYGGDGETEAEAGKYEEPLVSFPAHWAPNDLLFYSGDQFPVAARGSAFIAYHGSWNRAPLPQGGYNVVFVPFEGEAPAGDWVVFADGFKGAETIADSDDARYRPMGLAEGPDGALYVTDSQTGRIWKVSYEG